MLLLTTGSQPISPNILSDGWCLYVRGLSRLHIQGCRQLRQVGDDVGLGEDEGGCQCVLVVGKQRGRQGEGANPPVTSIHRRDQ
jgi:hypothetical protein